MANQSYKEAQRSRGIGLINNQFFAPDDGRGYFFGKQRDFVLKDGRNNLYPEISSDVIRYFKQNNIAWWGGSNVTGHVLSSQIACLNHLFAIRRNKRSILALLRAFSDDFVNLLPFEEEMAGYIQFEAVGGSTNLLNERLNTRGSHCTSIDALIRAVDEAGKRYLILVEWKYTEAYTNEDKSKGERGDERKERYPELISKSSYLNENTLSCCWFEPFYQLMRQTLWAEQTIRNKVRGFEAEDFLHVLVAPSGNNALLNKKYPCSGSFLLDTWKNCLTHPEKFILISPQELWSQQDENGDLYAYLKARYW